MQVKKEEVKKAILDAAVAEFMLHGFEGASLRQIVKKADTTIGNFYNYFSNKEALFEALVSESYDGFIRFIEQHETMDLGELEWMKQADVLNLGDMEQRRLLRQMVRRFVGVFGTVFNECFVLLVEGSANTPFADAKERLIQLLKSHYLEHSRHEQPSSERDAFAELLAGQLIGGIVSIIKYNPEHARKQLIADWISLFIFGIYSMG